MQRKMFIWIALVSVALLALGGCGSNKDSGGDSTTGTVGSFGTDANGITYVGADTCINCHEDFTWSSEAVAAYLEGKHVIHSTHVEATSEELCLSCHDPIGDGTTLDSLVDAANVPADGLAAVTCEACHGAGGEHYGVGPMPSAKPGADACGQCHNDRWTTEMPSHIAYHPEGNNIYEDYEAGAHNTIHTGAPCSKCHTDEGARMYKDYDTFESLFVVQEIDNPSNVQCRTCHDPHNPGELLEAEQTSGRGSSLKVTASAEYATCTNCHQRHDAQIATVVGDPNMVDITNLPGSTSTDGGSGDLIYHAARYGRVISSTHYDNPATVGLLEGYVLDPADERACRNCHNVHSADITINEQWADSGHGGEIIEAKNQAVIDAGYVDDGEPDDHALGAVAVYRNAGTTASWSKHGWPNDGEAECQRCHTATGGMNFLNGPVAYYDAMGAFVADQDLAEPTGVASPNDFSYLATDPDTGEYTQAELLFCWACHTNNVGGMRDPGSVTLQDRNGDFFGPVPDVGKSNVCIGCHGGRANGEYIRNTAAADRSTSGRVHHLPAAGALFAASTHTAYEFDLDGDGDAAEHYVNSNLKHDTIGLTGDAPAGPCASCHMPDANHTFSVVTTDATTGEITAITSQSLCDTCHIGGMTATTLQGFKVEYADVLQYFQDVAYAANGQTNYAGVTFSNSTFLRGRGDDVAGQNDYGALQNVKIMTSDAGSWGYAHNSIYAKRVIFDSLDWLDNAALDGSVIIPAAYPEARQWFGADALGAVTRP